MRPFQIFAAMSPEEAHRFFEKLSATSPAVFRQAVAAASAAMKARPRYLMKQPFEKRASAVRRALSRVTSDPIAEEMLAVYFLEGRKELLAEWLDAIGLEHEEGALKEGNPSEPPEERVRGTVESFLNTDDDSDRRLLLRAFAAQASIDWPSLDALIEG
jgi:hypothetical protein